MQFNDNCGDDSFNHVGNARFGKGHNPFLTGWFMHTNILGPTQRDLLKINLLNVPTPTTL